MTRPVALDLCCGGGGWSLGLHAAGWDTFGVELDGSAVDAYRRAVSGAVLCADLRKVRAPVPAQAVFAGVPCQPHSQAGRRGGLVDERGTLHREVARIAREAGAVVVVLENPRAIQWRDGVLDDVRAAMRAEGYAPATIWTLDAQDFGLAQRRRRTFVLFSSVPLVFVEPVGCAPRRTVRDVLGWPVDAVSPTVTATDWRACYSAGKLGGEPQVAKGVRGARRAGDVLKPVARALGEKYTPAHAAALQGLPVTLGEGLPALDRWRIIGNAVPPVLGEAVGRAVLDALWRAGLAPAPPAAPAAPGAPAQPVFVSPARRFRRLK